MLDCQIFEMWAGGHHLVCLLLHAATAVVLMLAFARMTGRLWTSALMAALFAIHPLRAESVAWIAERKDVLSGFFFAATLWAYADFAKKPFSWKNYGLVAALFGLGLLSKPMLVTLPFVLLLLDYWPLGRMGLSAWRQDAASLPAEGRPASARSFWRLAAEKLPLFAMAVPVAVATVAIQRKVMQLNGVVPGPLPRGKCTGRVLVLPRQIRLSPRTGAILIPTRRCRLPWVAGAALLVLVLITIAAVHWRRTQPQILVGWLWYLGMLVPVIGSVQVGDQSMAGTVYLSSADWDCYGPGVQPGLPLAGAENSVSPGRDWAWRC